MSLKKPAVLLIDGMHRLHGVHCEGNLWGRVPAKTVMAIYKAHCGASHGLARHLKFT